MTAPIPLVERISNYSVNLRHETISAEAIKLAKWLLFDSLGTALGGYQTALGKKTVKFVTEVRPSIQTTALGATIVGDGSGASLEDAAFANATLTKILGMDDSHRTASHIAAQVIPAVLATSELYKTSGRETIVAIVAAYDLAIRLGKVVNKAQRARGLDLKGTVGAIAAALAAGLCAKLDATTLSQALALAADMASGTEQYVYESGDCDTKDLVAGFAARSGVFAVQLAQSGFYGPRAALEGDYGFLRAFGDMTGSDAFDDLGETFAITLTAFKPHGGCRHTHQAVDAVQQILAKVAFHPADIEHIVVKTYRNALEPDFRIDPNPDSREVAGLSIRVATALALVRGSTWPSDFAYWDDPEVRRLRQITHIEIDPELEMVYPDKNGCRVEVTLTDGQTLQGHVDFAKGEPEFRMTEVELKDKFKALTKGLVAARDAEALFQTCIQLDTLTDIGRLLELTIVKKGMVASND